MSSAPEPEERVVTVVLKVYDELHPPVKFPVKLSATSSDPSPQLRIIPFLANSHLHKNKLPPINTANANMILDPYFPADTRFLDLPAELHTLTAYLPMKLNHVSVASMEALEEERRKQEGTWEKKMGAMEELMKKTMGAMEKRMRDSEEESKKLGKDMKEAKEESKKLEKEMKEAKEKSKKLEKEMKEAKEKSKKLEKEMKEESERLKKEMNKMEDENKRREKEIKDEGKKREKDIKRREKKTKEESEEREKEMMKEIDALKAQVDDLQTQSNDTTNYVVFGDTKALDRIRLRELLDHVQAKLAQSAGLVVDATDKHASRKWRDALSNSSGIDRVQIGLGLLSRSNVLISQATLDFMQSTKGMKLATDKPSNIRNNGHLAAHNPGWRLVYEETVNRHYPIDEREGLQDLIKYLFAE